MQALNLLLVAKNLLLNLLLLLLAYCRRIRKVMAHVSIPADLSTMLGRSRLPLSLCIVHGASNCAILLRAWYSICSHEFALILSNRWLFHLVGCRLLRRQTCSCCLKAPARNDLNCR